MLIADDEDSLREALRDLVQREPDLEVAGVAPDAESAIQLARRHQPDVALLDVKMPAGGGPRAAREIRMFCETTRVVALSAYEDRTSVLEMLRAGAVGYAVKGLSAAEVVEAIRRAARGQASFSADVMAGVLGALYGDLEEHRQSEEALRRSEVKLQGLLDSAPDAVVIVDGRGRMVLVNAETERLFGYERDELYDQPVEMLMPDRFRDRHGDHRGGYLADPTTRPMGVGLELAGRRKDGSEFPIDISLSAIETEEGRLVTAFVRDNSERVAAYELQRSHGERRALLAHLVAAGEEERQRIASDIHDDSIQVITAAGMRLQMLRDELNAPDQLALLDNLDQTIQLSISRLRHLLFELRPPALDREGLVPALNLYVREAEGQTPATSYSVEDRLVNPPDGETRLIIYRIVQEALTNVRKHADARSASVALEERDGGYAVTVVDDGAGFVPADAGPVPGHLGLATMRERAELAGGWLTLESAPEAGTTVAFWIPREGAPPSPETSAWQQPDQASMRGQRMAVQR